MPEILLSQLIDTCMHHQGLYLCGSIASRPKKLTKANEKAMFTLAMIDATVWNKEKYCHKVHIRHDVNVTYMIAAASLPGNIVRLV